jgi:uncharacterized protein
VNAAGPVAQPERISSLDTLRGFALLGILVMNIQSFAMPFAAYFNPTAYGDLTGINLAVYLVGRLLFDQKFMAIFSMLFGAGIVLLTTRMEARGEKPARIHFRRMVWLLLFGLAHAYLIWYGDILVLYAICGFGVYFARKLQPRTLLIVGLVVLMVSPLISVMGGLSMPYWPEKERQEFKDEMWLPPPDRVAAEVSAYRGGWLAQMPDRAEKSIGFHAFYIWIWGIWRAGGLMLIGMALYKWGVLKAECTTAFYRAIFFGGALAGVSLTGYGAYRNFTANWDVMYSFFWGDLWNYFGSLALSAGWVGMVMLACKHSVAPGLERRLAAVGQMAFTNYLLHTILSTTFFYGHGLGYFGTFERWQQFLFVMAVWVIQLVLSSIWLRHFRFGPFEWLWRSLTYGAAQPFRRRVPAAPSPAPAT